jgi:hypothetical protein
MRGNLGRNKTFGIWGQRLEHGLRGKSENARQQRTDVTGAQQDANGVAVLLDVLENQCHGAFRIVNDRLNQTHKITQRPLEYILEQRVFVRKMPKKCGVTDVRTVTDFTHRQGVVTFLEGQGYQGVGEDTSCLADAFVNGG